MVLQSPASMWPMNEVERKKEGEERRKACPGESCTKNTQSSINATV